MITPLFLNQRNTIGIVAPGRKIDRESIDQAKQIIESWGVQVALSKNLFSEDHSYLSASDEERLEDLQFMLDNPNVHAIICARGGYGTTRILDQLDLASFQKKPKWIVGFSDITSLHLKLHLLGVQSIHGTMPVLFSDPQSQSSVESLRKVLFGNTKDYIISAPLHSANQFGKCRGELIGGNLSLIIDSLGTNSEPDTKGKILVIEEIDEYLYKIDRMLAQLLRASKLQKLSGLVVGHMTSLMDTELSFGEEVFQIIKQKVSSFGYPVGFNFPIGHENPNLAWIHGATVGLEVTSKGSALTFI